MVVSNLSIEASADPTEICLGESVQLNANAAGGTGTYTYNWNSDPEGFTSQEQNPMALPAENTVYMVEVSDGDFTNTAEVSISVFDNPVVDLGPDEILCGENMFSLNAENEGDSYLWSTGETTQTIVAEGTGITPVWVEVTNQHGCATKDTIVLNFAAVPVVSLGADTVLCGGGNVLLNAGNEGADYLWSNGETTQTIQVDTAGHGYGVQAIAVEVTNQWGCVGTAEVNVEFKNCSSIDEREAISMKLYPNPSSGVFQLELSSKINQEVSLQVTNVTGKVVFEQTDIRVAGNGTISLDLTNLAGGVYQLVVKGKHASASEKLIINH